MAVLFDEILTKGVRQGQIPARTAKARDWYRGTAKQYKNVKENQFFGAKSDKDRMSSRPLIGGMYMYEYMAKTTMTTGSAKLTRSARSAKSTRSTMWARSTLGSTRSTPTRSRRS